MNIRKLNALAAEFILLKEIWKYSTPRAAQRIRSQGFLYAVKRH